MSAKDDGVPGIASMLEILSKDRKRVPGPSQPVPSARLAVRPDGRAQELGYDELLRAVDPAVRQSFERLCGLAPEANRLLLDSLASVARWLDCPVLDEPARSELKGALSRPGVLVLKARTKSKDRALREIVQRAPDGDPSLLTDLVRGAIGVDHADDLPMIGVALRAARIDPVAEPASRFLLDGYWDCRLIFRLPNEVVAELQLHLKPMLERREIGVGGDPPAQELWERRRRIEERAAAEGRALTPSERRQCQELLAHTKHWFDEAWESATRLRTRSRA
jgi:hypothetical protein